MKFNHKHEDQQQDEQAPQLIAKRDHILHQNEFHREIKQGDDVSDVPAHLLEALKTEGVI